MCMSFIAILLLVFAGILPAQSNNPLEPFVWKNRVILILHAPEKADLANEQLELLVKQMPDLNERQLVIGVAVGVNELSIGGELLSANSSARLQQIYNPDGADFLLVLIGKDGGVKLRKSDLVTPQSIFDLVDSMPMRQSEMKKN